MKAIVILLLFWASVLRRVYAARQAFSIRLHAGYHTYCALFIVNNDGLLLDQPLLPPAKNPTPEKADGSSLGLGFFDDGRFPLTKSFFVNVDLACFSNRNILFLFALVVAWARLHL